MFSEPCVLSIPCVADSFLEFSGAESVAWNRVLPNLRCLGLASVLSDVPVVLLICTFHVPYYLHAGYVIDLFAGSDFGKV